MFERLFLLNYNNLACLLCSVFDGGREAAFEESACGSNLYMRLLEFTSSIVSSLHYIYIFLPESYYMMLPHLNPIGLIS